MLRTMRKHGSKWVLGFLVVIISVVFVFTFGFNNKGQADKTLAEVGSHRITAMEYQDAYRRAAEFERMQGKTRSDEDQMKLKEIVMNELIDKYVLLKKAGEMGISVSDREFTENLTQAGFNKNGKFDRQAYLEYLRRSNLEPKTFEENHRQSMVIGRMMSIIMDNGMAVIDEKAVYEGYTKQRGQVKLSVAVFDPDEYKGKVVVDDKELNDLYEREKGVYRSENTFHLKYMVIDEKSGVRDDQAYMDLLKSKDLTAYGKAKGLEVVDLGTMKESELLSKFGGLKIEDALKGVNKGDITLPMRAENRSFIFQVVEREEGKPLEKSEALKVIRTRVAAEKAKTMARMKAEDAIRDKGLRFTKDTGFIARNSTTLPGIGPVPKVSAGLLALSRGQVFQSPVEVNGKFYVFAYADEKQPDKDQWEKEKDMYSRLYAAEKRNAFFTDFKDDLRKSIKVKTDWKDL